MHALVVSLDSGFNARIVVLAFQRAVSEKIHLHIIKAVIREHVHPVIDSQLRARMGWVNGNATVVHLIVAVTVAQQNILVVIHVSGALYGPPPRIVRRTEPDKRPEINSGLLAVGVAMVDKTLQFRAAHIVPEGIQINPSRAVVLKVGTKLIVEKI